MKISIAEKIKALRRGRDMTQDELASVLGVTSQSVSKWETGVAYPDIETIPIIANYFEVSVDELFGMDALRDETAEKQRLDEFWEQWQKMNLIGEPTEEFELAQFTQFARDYPRNKNVQFGYAVRLLELPDLDKKREGVRILERLVAEWVDGSRRYDVQSHLVRGYIQLGERERAEAMIAQLPQLHQAQESVTYFQRFQELVDTVELGELTPQSETGAELLDVHQTYAKFVARCMHRVLQRLEIVRGKLGLNNDEYHLQLLHTQRFMRELMAYEDEHYAGVLENDSEHYIKLARLYAARDKEKALEYFLQFVERYMKLPIIGEHTVRMMELDPNAEIFQQMAAVTEAQIIEWMITPEVHEALRGNARYDEVLEQVLERQMAHQNPREYMESANEN